VLTLKSLFEKTGASLPDIGTSRLDEAAPFSRRRRRRTGRALEASHQRADDAARPGASPP
jgi:hypothetical protein